MNDEFQQYLEQTLIAYTQGEHYQTLLKAKEEYFRLTGTSNEEDDDFENKMSCFNDWYLFQFISEKTGKTIMEEHLKQFRPRENILKALENVTYSFFEYAGKNFKEEDVVRDLMHKTKTVLASGHGPISLLKNDIFVGRMIKSENLGHLLNGRSFLPKEARSKVLKQARKIRKLNDLAEETKFLIQVESFNTKWMRYGHVDVDKIFVFD